MPLLHLHLLQFTPGVDIRQIINDVKKDGRVERVILASKPHYWVVKPSKHDISALTSHEWELMLLLQPKPGSDISTLPTAILSRVRRHYTVVVGVPSKLLAGYAEKNAELLRKAPSVPLTGSLDSAASGGGAMPADSQDLALDANLRDFMNTFTTSRGPHQPVTMLNLLSFKKGEGASAKESYARYGREFRATGGRRGGDAKIVGNVVREGGAAAVTGAESGREWWDEVAIVHYPSIRHFCDMAAGEDYQASNRRYRLPALFDTILLCTTELDLTHESKL